jgi:hypothetical protein
MDEIKPKFTPPNSNKKVFQFQKGNEPEFLDKADEIVYARGRKSFDDVRKKIMETPKKTFIWGPKFDDKKLDWTVDKDPLKKSFSFLEIRYFGKSLITIIKHNAKIHIIIDKSNTIMVTMGFTCGFLFNLIFELKMI